MNIIKNNLSNKILFFNVVIVLSLSLFFCFYLPWRFKIFAVKERSKTLAQLNEQITLMLHYAVDGSPPLANEKHLHDKGVIKILSKNSGFTYAMIIGVSGQPKPHILYGLDKAIGISDLFEEKPEKTEVVKRANMLHVISPIVGYDKDGKETKLGFLLSGFSLESLNEEILRIQFIIIGLCIAFVVLGIVSGFIQSRFLVKSLKETIKLIKIVAKGNYTQKLEFTSRDGLGELIQALNSMIRTWKDSIVKIKGAIDLSNPISYKISVAADQQEKITIQEASSVSEITATVEELNNASKQVSENAEQIAKRSHDVLKIAFNGQHSVDKSTEEFNALREKVRLITEHILDLSKRIRQIGEIMENVSSIANKTDMLAINAGIEAARSGEQGKGFSVVVAEIRNLADQSQRSTAKIFSLIEKIQTTTHATVMATEQGVKGVEEGIQLILETGRNLSAAIDNMQETVDSVQEIALSSRQQSLATDQVAETMVSINKDMKETTVAAKKTLKEIENLQSLSHELQEMVNSYEV